MDENTDTQYSTVGSDADSTISRNANNNSLSDLERTDQGSVATTSAHAHDPSAVSSTLPLSTSASTATLDPDDPDFSPPPPDYYESPISPYSPASLLPPVLPGLAPGVVYQGRPPPYIADPPEYSEQRPLSDLVLTPGGMSISELDPRLVQQRTLMEEVNKRHLMASRRWSICICTMFLLVLGIVVSLVSVHIIY